MSAEAGPSGPPRHAGDFAASTRTVTLSAIAAVIGLTSTLGAGLLLGAIRLFTNLFYFHALSLAPRSPADSPLGIAAALNPVVGGLLVGLLARFGSEKIRGHGIPEAIEAILYGGSRMSGLVAVLKPLSSGISIGSGGPFGAEGPIIMTGGATASLMAQALHLTAAERKALLVAGACAGMTAIFGTPLAAVLLAVELLLFELRPRSLLPVAMACAVAGLLRPLWLGAAPLFPLTIPPMSGLGSLSCAGLGLATGVVSALTTRLLYWIEDVFARLPVHWMWWPALGGAVVGLGGLIEPRALGVGYDVIADLLQQHVVLATALGLLLVKLLIWSVALGSGTSGGVLAPLLIIGAGLGTVLAGLLPGGSPGLWALIGLSAMLAGTMRAPLTAVIFAFELTHAVPALLPTLLASAIAYGFTVIVMPRSILTEKIARRGRHVYREYGVDPLERHFVNEVMTTHVISVPASVSARSALHAYFGRGQRHRAYPVTVDGRLLGMIDRAVLQGLPESALHLTLQEVLREPASPAFATPEETCKAVAARLAALGLERLPVLDAQSRLIGIVSRSDLLKPLLQIHREEEHRERLFGA